MINFTVYGDPVPWGRPRFVRRGNYMQAYVDKNTKKGKSDFIKQSWKHRPEAPLAGSLFVEIRVYRKMPKAFSITKRAQAESGFIMPVTRPDLDNYIKLVMDAMNGRFYIDDSQITQLTCSKNYSDRPRTTVSIQEV